MASGLIYVLINPSFRNLLKIGKTTRTSEERALEISISTGVPTKYLVAYDQETEDCDLAERTIHKRFEKQRYGKDREFFELKLKNVVPVIVEIIDSIDKDVRAEKVKVVVKQPLRGSGVEVIDKENSLVAVWCQRCDEHFSGTVTQQNTIDCPLCKSRHYIDWDSPYYI